MSKTRRNHSARSKALLAVAFGLAAVVVLALPGFASAAPTTTDNAVAAYNNTAVISLTATPGVGGTYKYTVYSFDGGSIATVAAWPSSATISLPMTNVGMTGSHTLDYFSVDTNTSAEATIGQQTGVTVHKSFTLANTLPLILSSNLTAYDNSATITFTGVQAVGGLAVASTWYSLDGGPAVSAPAVTVTAAGFHTLVAWAKDAGGNAGFPISMNFTISDTILPTVSSNAAGPYAGSATITLSGTDASGIASLWYSLDNGDWKSGNVVTVTAAGDHSLSYYSVDNTGLHSAIVTKAFTVTVVDATAPVTTLTGVTNGAALAAGSTAHITLTSSDFGSGMASLNYTVDGVAKPVVTAGVRAAAFGAPDLAVPTVHAGGSAAALTAANASCVAVGCHPTWVLPTAGVSISHAGVTTGCKTCHTFVDASAIVEPADHATHDPSISCSQCHGTSLVPAIMPTDNNGNHFLPSDPNGGSNCSDCHTYTIASGTTPPVSTASTFTVAFDVAGAGSHTITCWGVDKAGNTEVTKSLTFSIAQSVNPPVATSLTIGSSASSIKLGKAFNLSGLLTGTPGANGLMVTLMVKKPGKSFYSYSSNRLTYGAGAASSLWQNNNYKPTAKGAYTFYVTFAGSGNYQAAPNSSKITVTVK
jgi:hypothetical protein